jgi:hypothetical protein
MASSPSGWCQSIGWLADDDQPSSLAALVRRPLVRRGARGGHVAFREHEQQTQQEWDKFMYQLSEEC